MWYGEMCVHLYDLLDVLAAKATATTAAAKAKATTTTEATATTAAANKNKSGSAVDRYLARSHLCFLLLLIYT